MKNIDVLCIDQDVARQVALRLSNKVKDIIENEVVFIDPYSTLFGQVIRLLKSYYSTMPFKKTSLVFLEAAKENEIQEHFVYGKIKTNTLFIKSGSFFVSTFLNMMIQQDIRRVLTKFLLRKLAMKPNYLIYLKINIPKYVKKRKKLFEIVKLEGVFKGHGIVSREKNLMKYKDKLESKFRIKTCIIDVEQDEDIDTTVNKILNQIDFKGLFLGE